MDGRVIVAAHAERALGKHLAVFYVGLCALLVENVEQHAVFCLAGHDNHVLEVLGSGADERDAAYVDLLDDVGFRSAACHSLLEGIEVNDDEVDFRNVVFFHLLSVALVVAAAQNASKHFGVECLHASTQD